MKGGGDAVTREPSLPRNPPPEKAAAADHEKVHQRTVTQTSAGRGDMRARAS